MVTTFGPYDYPKAIYDLMHLKQTRSVEGYFVVFDDLRYAAAVHNPQMGELFYVTQFVKGLKEEIQGPVLCQIHTTMSIVVLLTQLHQDVWPNPSLDFRDMLVMPELQGHPRWK